jgi:lipid II:glycine glycyltransferase (peptidoglycan interpeptide bridge formation enzyme)
MVINGERHLLQSNEWALFQKATGKKIVQRSGSGWQYLAVLETGDGKIGKLFKRLYVPYGPSYKDKQALKKALDDLEIQAKGLNCDYVRVEPVSSDRNSYLKSINGYAKTRRTFQPQLTLIIDLDRPLEDILKDMTKTNRYLYKKASENNLKFTTSYKSADLTEFLKMMNATSKRTKALFRPDSYYQQLLGIFGPKKQAGISYVSIGKEILAGALFVDDIESKTRYYMFAGSFDRARKYSANSPLLTYLIEGAKKRDFKYFDLFGVSPLEDVNHRWAGLSKFKRSFGGQEIKYCGTYEKPIKKIKYKAMATARKLIQ